MRREFYRTSVSLETVDKDATYINTKGASERLKGIISEMGIQESEYEIVGSMCYDDIAIDFKDKFKAVMVAAKLDSVLEDAPEGYRVDYDIVHNAMVTGPWVTVEDEDGFAEDFETETSRVIYRG